MAALTGAVEPPAALAAYAAFELAGPLLAGALAFAAGAMLYVVVDELIPGAAMATATNERRHSRCSAASR